MAYDIMMAKAAHENDVSHSTMMKSPCLRYKGQFMTMMFEKEDSLIIKVSPERVDEIIATGKGREFNFTKKRFKEWVLIPRQFEDQYDDFIYEAVAYAKNKEG